MTDFLKKIYYLVDDDLPPIPLRHEAEQALEATLTAEQASLLEAYREECFRNTEAERFQLFRHLLFLGHRLGRLWSAPNAKLF